MKRALPMNSKRFMSGDMWGMYLLRMRPAKKAPNTPSMPTIWGQGCTHEKHRHDEDELHDGITVAAQKPAGKTGNEEYHKTAIGCKLGGEEYPEEYAVMFAKRGNETC